MISFAVQSGAELILERALGVLRRISLEWVQLFPLPRRTLRTRRCAQRLPGDLWRTPRGP